MSNHEYCLSPTNTSVELKETNGSRVVDIGMYHESNRLVAIFNYCLDVKIDAYDCPLRVITHPLTQILIIKKNVFPHPKGLKIR